MDIKEVLGNPELLNQLKDALGLKGKSKGDGKNGFLAAQDLEMPKLSDNQIKNIAKDLNKKKAHPPAQVIPDSMFCRCPLVFAHTHLDLERVCKRYGSHLRAPPGLSSTPGRSGWDRLNFWGEVR